MGYDITKHYDIIKHGDKYAVFPRKAYNGEYYEENAYEGEPVFTDESEDQCICWCEEHKADFRVRAFVATVPSKFLLDLEKKFDDWRKKLDEYAEECGYHLDSNITYRASAAWKEQPTHYCYIGDFGGSANLICEDESKAQGNKEALRYAKDYLWSLFGAAQAVWELGFTVTYDKDGKHTIYGAYPKWVTKDSAEFEL